MLPAITLGLQDLDDDVRAVAASALIPVVEGLVQLLPNKVRKSTLIKFGCVLALLIWSTSITLSLRVGLIEEAE